MKDTPILALKIIKRGGGVYFGPLFYGSALNFHFVYLAIPGTRPLSIYDKTIFFCCIYMQPQKVKFLSDQINMKQVSWLTLCILIDPSFWFDTISFG